MHFALLGDHPDGLDMAHALLDSGRHELVAYNGDPVHAKQFQNGSRAVRVVPDVEEILADPAVEIVIVASTPADRPNHLRRALQAERHVLCVHPADVTPDTAHEAAMIQQDARVVLLPLLPLTCHPGFGRLKDLMRADGPLGSVQLVEMEWMAGDEQLLASGERLRPAVPGWDALRLLGGEIEELAAFAPGQESSLGESVLVSGRFEAGFLFRALLLAGQPRPQQRWTAIGIYSRAELSFSTGWPGPARLTWQDEAGAAREEAWEAWHPWRPLVGVFETAVNGGPPSITWQSATRCLELDDAVRRSILRRRVISLEYPAASEEVGFKSTMTLVGCALLWGLLVLAILAAWFPWLGWIVVPVLLFFLGLQILRWLVPAAADGTLDKPLDAGAARSGERP